MVKTVLFLIATLILVPVLAIGFDKPLTELQIEIMQVLAAELTFFWLLCFVVAELTKNYSQTDKLWSITPLVYVWTAACMSGWEPRMVLVASLISVWGARLTYNFGRQGGYSWKFWGGHQDYRWDYVRKTTAPLQGEWGWRFFNLLFIAGYQHGLLLLISLPVVMMIGTGAPGIIDYVLAAVLLGLVAIETVADRQQWNFQAEKYRRLNAGEKLEELPEPYNKGFVHTGLWARSRHPNYFAEQSIWVTVFLFGMFASGRVNWTIAGCLLLIVLFRNSSELAETITTGKYSQYADYKRQLPRFLPLFKRYS